MHLICLYAVGAMITTMSTTTMIKLWRSWGEMAAPFVSFFIGVLATFARV
jgi:hypothetical protein